MFSKTQDNGCLNILHNCLKLQHLLWRHTQMVNGYDGALSTLLSVSFLPELVSWGGCLNSNSVALL